ncbi:MAG: universal stress protein [Burkholderiaceae bacterium]|nr:universal stress protein [Burkholderiaceae bacterium]
MKILLPIDGSKTSLSAAKYVAQLVANIRSKCSVTLISVHDDFGLNHVKQFVSKSVVDDYLREISEKELKPAQKVLDAVRTEGLGTIPCRTLIDSNRCLWVISWYDLASRVIKGRLLFDLKRFHYQTNRNEP